VLPKAWLDYASLRKINPEIVMYRCRPSPPTGMERMPGLRIDLEQASGLPSQSGAPDGPPTMNHIAYGDPIGGLNAAAALLVAIFHKRRTNQGQHIDISQVECMLPMVAAMADRAIGQWDGRARDQAAGIHLACRTAAFPVAVTTPGS